MTIYNTPFGMKWLMPQEEYFRLYHGLSRYIVENNLKAVSFHKDKLGKHTHYELTYYRCWYWELPGLRVDASVKGVGVRVPAATAWQQDVKAFESYLTLMGVPH